MNKVLLVVFLFGCLGLHAQDTQGFFLNDSQAKKAVVPPCKEIKPPKSVANVRVTIDASNTIATVSPYLYGNNTNPYMTQIVTEPKLLAGIKALSPKILRFPGGNISNVYFWDALPNEKPTDVPETILYGDKDKRGRQQVWVGRDNNAKTLSVENYYKLLEQTGSTGTICVNAGYARYGTGTNPIANAAHYAANWVRFDKGRTKFWEVGNEDYGTWQAGYKIDTSLNKDNQPEFTNGILYGQIFKAFSDSMHAAANELGKEIQVGATLIETNKFNKWDNEIVKGWNNGFFATAKNAADFFIIHSYYTQYNHNSTAENILASATSVTTNMMHYMKGLSIQHNISPKPIALTEWNIFAEGSKQQTSYINGKHAAIVLGELARNKYGMACRWNLANGYNNGNDHGMFNKGDEPGMPKWSARPVYYYMYYFQQFFGDKMLAASVSDINVIAYASSFSNNKHGVILINKDTSGRTVSIHFNKGLHKGKYYGYTLTGGNDNGEFSQKVIINGVQSSLPAGGPEDYEGIKAWKASFKKYINIYLPARAVAYMLVDKP